MKPERVLALVLVCVSSVLYVTHTITLMRPNDPTGYLYGGLRIAGGGLPSHSDQNNTLAGPYFSLNAFKVQSGEDKCALYLQHPPGLPLLIAAASLLMPLPMATFYVVPCLAIAGVAGTFTLGTLLFNERIGLLAAALLAFSPIYLRFGTETWSDIPAMTFVLLSLITMITSVEHRSLRWGLLSGSLMGYAILIRYPSMGALLPLALFVYLEYDCGFLVSKGGRGFLAALALIVVIMLLFNRVYYGAFLLTSHYPRGGLPWRPYSIRYLIGASPMGGNGLAGSIHTLGAAFPYSWPLIVPGWVLMKRRTGVLLAGMCIVFVVFYSTHIKPPIGVNSRLLITVFPPCAMMIGVSLHRISQRFLRSNLSILRLGLPLGLLLLLVLPPLPSALAALRERNMSTTRKVDWVVQVSESTPPNAVFISSEHDDWLRIYGDRSALNPTRVAVPAAGGEGYDEAQFEPALVTAGERLLSSEIPVYYIDDCVPEHMTFMGTYEVMSRHYELSVHKDADPTVYEVKSKRQ